MKKQLKIIVPILVLSLLGYLGYGVITKMQDKQAKANTLKTIPDFSFKRLDSTYFTKANLKPNTAIIFIYFNSTCDFCQHEAESISQHLDQFKNTQLLFVSTEDSNTIKTFAQAYNLLNQPNITFLYDNSDTFSSQFGANSIPYLLIYNTKQELVKTHKGQLKANAILKLLNL